MQHAPLSAKTRPGKMTYTRVDYTPAEAKTVHRSMRRESIHYSDHFGCKDGDNDKVIGRIHALNFIDILVIEKRQSSKHTLPNAIAQ